MKSSAVQRQLTHCSPSWQHHPVWAGGGRPFPVRYGTSSSALLHLHPNPSSHGMYGPWLQSDPNDQLRTQYVVTIFLLLPIFRGPTPITRQPLTHTHTPHTHTNHTPTHTTSHTHTIHSHTIHTHTPYTHTHTPHTHTSHTHTYTHTTYTHTHYTLTHHTHTHTTHSHTHHTHTHTHTYTGCFTTLGHNCRR